MFILFRCFGQRNNTVSTIIILLVLTFLTGCTPEEPFSNESNVQIVVFDDQTLRPIKQAEVNLILPKQIFPVEYTDNTGRAFFEVGNDLLDGVSDINIYKEGYEPQQHGVMLSNTPVLTVYLVPLGATAVPRVTPSVTPIPATPRPDDTATATPTTTHTPTPTNTPIATLTNTPVSPAPVDIVTLTRREGANTVFVLAGPGVENLELGTLAMNEVAEVIGRTSSDEWLKIITQREIEGWVADCEVDLSSTDLSAIPIEWPGLVTPKNCKDDLPLPPASCVTISLDRIDWPSREFDDILLSWINVPTSAIKLELWVTGPKNSGETDYVIHPTFSDVNASYKVELFKFEDGNFLPGATYAYVVRPYDAANNVICTSQGTFVP